MDTEAKTRDSPWNMNPHNGTKGALVIITLRDHHIAPEDPVAPVVGRRLIDNLVSRRAAAARSTSTQLRWRYFSSIEKEKNITTEKEKNITTEKEKSGTTAGVEDSFTPGKEDAMPGDK